MSLVRVPREERRWVDAELLIIAVEGEYVSIVLSSERDESGDQTADYGGPGQDLRPVHLTPAADDEFVTAAHVELVERRSRGERARGIGGSDDFSARAPHRRAREIGFGGQTTRRREEIGERQIGGNGVEARITNFPEDRDPNQRYRLHRRRANQPADVRDQMLLELGAQHALERNLGNVG